MRSYQFCLLLFACVCFAQTKTVTATPSDIAVSGGLLFINADGTCDVTPFFSDPTRTPATRRQLGAARCTAMTAALIRAATLDVGVSDGGNP